MGKKQYKSDEEELADLNAGVETTFSDEAELAALNGEVKKKEQPSGIDAAGPSVGYGQNAQTDTGTLDSDTKRVQSILDKNANKNFVDRIIHKDKYPTLDLGNGDYATHKMAWSDTDNGAIVYPTVVYDKKTNKLKQLGDKEAVDYALKNNEYLSFDKPEDADWFSKNYKRVWGKEFAPQPEQRANPATASWSLHVPFHPEIEQRWNELVALPSMEARVNYLTEQARKSNTARLSATEKLKSTYGGSVLPFSGVGTPTDQQKKQGEDQMVVREVDSRIADNIKKDIEDKKAAETFDALYATAPGNTPREKTINTYKAYLKETNPEKYKYIAQKAASKDEELFLQAIHPETKQTLAAPFSTGEEPLQEAQKIRADLEAEALQFEQSSLRHKAELAARAAGDVDIDPSTGEIYSKNLKGYTEAIQQSNQLADFLEKQRPVDPLNPDNKGLPPNTPENEQAYNRLSELQDKIQGYEQQGGIHESIAAYQGLQKQYEENQKNANDLLTHYPELAAKYIKKRNDQIIADKELSAAYGGPSGFAVAAEENLVRPISSSVARFVDGLASFPRTVTPNNEYGWTDKLADYSGRMVEGVYGATPVRSEKDTRGKMTWSNVIPKTVETLSDMALMMATAEFGGGLAGKAKAAGQVAGELAGSFVETHKQYYDDAIDAGLTPQNASIFSTGQSLVQSVLELINPEYKVLGKETSKGAIDTFKKLLLNGVSKYDAAKEAAKYTLKNTVKENVQEFSQSAADKMIKIATNEILGSNFNDTSFTQSEFNETLVITTLASGLIGLAAKGRRGFTSDLEKGALYTAANNPAEFLKAIDDRRKAGTIDEARAQALAQAIHETSARLKALPENLSEDKKADILALQMEKAKITEQMNQPGRDEVFKAQDKAIIEHINEAITKVAGKTPVYKSAADFFVAPSPTEVKPEARTTEKPPAPEQTEPVKVAETTVTERPTETRKPEQRNSVSVEHDGKKYEVYLKPDKSVDYIQDAEGNKAKLKVGALQAIIEKATGKPITQTPTENAIQEPSTEEILQREPQETGSAGSERGRVEPSQQGQEPAESRTIVQGRQDKGEKKTRSFVKQVRSELEQPIAEETYNERAQYIAKKNVVTAKEAKDTVDELGDDGAERLVKDTHNDIPFSHRVAVGQQLLRKWNEQIKNTTDESEKKKLASRAANLALDLAEYGTKLGQGVQAYALLKKLTPEGTLMYVQKKFAKDRRQRLKPHEADIQRGQEQFGESVKEAGRKAAASKPVENAVEKAANAEIKKRSEARKRVEKKSNDLKQAFKDIGPCT